jgi:hypothetical protein
MVASLLITTAAGSYGTGLFLSWLVERGVEPHVPVLERKHQTEGKLTRDAFVTASDAFVTAILVFRRRARQSRARVSKNQKCSRERCRWRPRNSAV